MSLNSIKSLRLARLLIAAWLLVCTAAAGADVVLTGEDEARVREEPVPGSLVLPDGQEQKQDGEKCMTVCARWGEECVYINRGAGGTERKCRRTCQQFTSECF